MSHDEFEKIQQLIVENERMEQQLLEKHQPDLGNIWLYIGIMWSVYGIINHIITSL